MKVRDRNVKLQQKDPLTIGWKNCPFFLHFCQINALYSVAIYHIHLIDDKQKHLPNHANLETGSSTNLLVGKNKDNCTFQLFLLPKGSKPVSST